MSKISELYEFYVATGTKNLTDSVLKNRVRYSNIVTFSSIVLIGIPTLILSFLFAQSIIYLPILFILSCLFVLLLQYFYFSTASRFLIAVLPSIMLSIFCTLILPIQQQQVLGFAVISVASLIIPFIVFELKESRILILSEAVALLFFVIFSGFGNLILRAEISHFHVNRIGYLFITFFSLGVFVYFMRLLAAINHLSEFTINEQTRNLNLSNKKIEDLQHSLDETILEMQNFKSEQEKLKELEKQREWSNSGITKFVDILRLNNNNIKELTYSVISNLVKYLKANQGGIYMLSDEKDEAGNTFFEMTAAYAYDKQKFINRRIILGEGLIGNCAMEKKYINLADIPEDYIKITSGLGEAAPRNLLIIPIINEDKVYGVIELASFEIFKQFEIEFVEKVAENIGAGVISTIMQNKTNDLINEMKKQAEVSRTQEEELRQNVEEMQATQEEMQKKEAIFREFAMEMGIDENVLKERFNI